ncbi:hypothetical protein CAPTEDRAFT_199088 [Capitella teleta]|uniref:peptidylprolyl isomerase n=1 Tax=Capitella teleta TaxID=283909 RepID=R7ULJ4_CAPTE|nr:hypothetical protein CAPTEDRAFT_199088 [Capitella teleta]|eukprot:ELU07414.1 hypothetical protein CAPTEDRAFT_199088 [Capitella teleta]
MFSFGGEEDGDEFLLPSGGNSKLASLFGADASGSPSSNESLKYTAPKEPKKVQTAAPSASGLLIDGKYSSQGKLGAAVIGTHSPPDIALAKANATEGAMDAVVSQDLFLPPEGSPLELGDSVEVRFTGWLFNEGTAGEVFETNTSSEKLLRCKLGKGKIIKGHEEGLLGMKKGGKRLLVIPPQLGYGSDGKQGIPSNATLVIESEIVRVGVNLLKFIVITGLFNLKVKHMKDKGKSTPQSSRSTTPVPKEEEEEDEADGRKSRTKSITESISDQLTTVCIHGLSTDVLYVISHFQQPNKSDKAKLISRMAKMGQPMLPRGSIGHDDHEVPTTPGSVEGKPDIPIKPATINQTHEGVAYSQPPSAAAQPVVGGYPPQYIQPMAAQQPPLAPPTVMQGIPNGNQMALYQSSMQQPGYPPAPYNAIYGQQPYQAAPPPAPPSTDTPVLLSETRQQNTEVRLCLSKVSDKVDRIMEKVDHMHSQQQQIAQPNTSYNMETSALMHNIQRIVQENERLKKEVFEKSSRIESQNDKISDLLHRNQKFMEQSNVLLEQRNDSFKSTATQSQARVLTLEQEKVELSSRLSAVTSEVGVLQLELTAVKKVAAESQLQLQKSLGEEEKYREQINKDKLTSSENCFLFVRLSLIRARELLEIL